MRFLLSILVPITSGFKLEINNDKEPTTATITGDGTDCTLTLIFGKKYEVGQSTDVDPCLPKIVQEGFQNKDLLERGGIGNAGHVTGHSDRRKYDCKHDGNLFASYSGDTPKAQVKSGFGQTYSIPLNENRVCRLIAKKYDEVKKELEATPPLKAAALAGATVTNAIRAAETKRGPIQASLEDEARMASLKVIIRMDGEVPNAFRVVITRLLNCLKVQANAIDVSDCCMKDTTATQDWCSGTSSLRLMHLEEKDCIPSSASDDEIVAFCVQNSITFKNWHRDLIKGFSFAEDKDKENYSLCYYSGPVQEAIKTLKESPKPK